MRIRGLGESEMEHVRVEGEEMVVVVFVGGRVGRGRENESERHVSYRRLGYCGLLCCQSNSR